MAAPVASRAPRRTGLLLLLVALAGAGLFGLSRSPAVRLQAVDVHAGKRVPEAEIRALSGVAPGDFIWAASPETVARRVEREAWVKEAKVTRAGNTLSIAVTEREPIALFPYGQGFYLALDETGVILGLQRLTDGVLPVISGAQISGALRGRAIEDQGVRDALTLLGWMAPELRAQVSEVNVGSERRLSLFMTGGATVRWGRLSEKPEVRADEVQRKLAELGGFWQQVPKGKGGCLIDLRVTGRLISSGCE
jgi:cell division septal protein FtsQ